MVRCKAMATGLIAALAATQVSAQALAPPDPPFSVVAPADRLTLGGVFMDADIVVKLLMAGLILATLAALALWIAGDLRPRGKAAGAITYLSGLGAAAPLVGLFAAAYTLLHSFIGLSNVRPAPTLSIMAPGFAEATFSLALGLLAAAIGVIGHRQLKARLQALGAASQATAGESADISPQVRLAG